MDTLLNECREFASKADDRTRRQMIRALRNLAIEIEKPTETLHRFECLAYELTCCKIGIDTGLFVALSEAKTPLSLEGISNQTGVTKELLGRLLRFLVATHMIGEVAEGGYTATDVSRTFAKQNFADGICFQFDFIARVLLATPQYLKEHDYRACTDPLDTPLQKGMDTKLHAMRWLQTRPDMTRKFTNMLSCFRETEAGWVSNIGLREHCRASSASDVLFVDVGGNTGAEAVKFRAALGDTPGRVVVQDLKETIDSARPVSGVELTVHDFFQPQPVQGARYYFLRYICHDYPDELCGKILRNLIPAMGPQSRLLINERVLLDHGADLLGVQRDLLMMVTQAGMERTEMQWRDLLSNAGLSVLSVNRYDEFGGQSIIEAIPSAFDSVKNT